MFNFTIIVNKVDGTVHCNEFLPTAKATDNLTYLSKTFNTPIENFELVGVRENQNIQDFDFSQLTARENKILKNIIDRV